MEEMQSLDFRPRATQHALPVVHVVDADPVVLGMLEPLIRSAGFLPCLSTTAEEFLARPRAESACCLLVEKRLPDLDGLELQQRLADRHEMPVIFMSTEIDVAATVQAMKAGAIEFLTKPLSVLALTRVLEHAIERSHRVMLRRAELRQLAQRYASLSRREREVMGLVVSGRLNKQTGGVLGISEITVKSHRGRLMRKMQAGSLAELVMMAATLRAECIADTFV